MSTTREDIVLIFDLARRFYARPEVAKTLPTFEVDPSGWAAEFCRLAARGVFGPVTETQRRRLLLLSGEVLSLVSPPPPVRLGRPQGREVHTSETEY